METFYNFLFEKCTKTYLNYIRPSKLVSRVSVMFNSNLLVNVTQ